MRKLILKMSVSIDGFVAGPEGQIDWLFRSMDEEGKAWVVDAISNVGLHLMGSRTFRDMAAYWPTSTEPFAGPMNDVPKVVFSTRGASSIAGSETTRALEDARARVPRSTHGSGAIESWTSPRVASGDLTEEIRRLQHEPGKDLLAHGGARFAQSLVERDLVDEYRLVVHPVALGRGMPLFSKLAQPIDLRLVEAKAFGSGAMAHVYRRR